jgi:RHH-type proline utilization regulon transcriptional repressor/proline dehydrogenase/delta 1-pyrroline-5-carboxylate dehydrogenase
MSNSGRLLYQCDAPSGQGHTFFAPRLYEISNLSLLEREVFGPVVHVIRYRADALDQIIDQINATGYGLTFGIHSRIEDITAHVAERVQAGNIYINRNMIGAIVGVQPFGGRGLSGTGPKAGGPQYLGRLVTTGAEAENADGQLPLPCAGDSSTLETLQSAPAAQKAWKQRSLNDRLSALRQFIARYSQRPADEHGAILEETLAAARSQLLYARDVLEQPLQLPGPTGESNQLLLEARGQLLLVLDNRDHAGEYLLAMLSALAGGNVVAAFAEEELLGEWQGIISVLLDAGLPKHCASVAPLSAASDALSSQHVNGAMVHARSAYLHDVARRLAERDGPLVPLITCVSPQALLRQTLLEKTVSIDTTAAGGNASLMTMAS